MWKTVIKQRRPASKKCLLFLTLKKQSVHSSLAQNTALISEPKPPIFINNGSMPDHNEGHQACKYICYVLTAKYFGI